MLSHRAILRRRTATVTFADSDRQDAGATTYTFTSKNLGTPTSDRIVIVGATGLNGASRTFSSVTVAGVTAQQVAFIESAAGGGFIPTGLFIASVPSVAVGDVVVTFSAAANRCGIGVWAASGLKSGVAVQTATSSANPQSFLMHIPVGGILVGYSHNWQSGVALTVSWSGITTSFDQSIETSVPSSRHLGVCVAAGAVSMPACICTPSGLTAGSAAMVTLV